MKNKLDDLLEEKETIDEKLAKLNKEITDMEKSISAPENDETSVISNDADIENNMEGISKELEVVKEEKEGIMKRDAEVETENAKLWEKASALKSQMEHFSVVDATLEEDSKEVNEIFDKINYERSILIEKDKLLNDRYHAIYDGIRSVCIKRMEIKEKMEENSDLKADMEKWNF